MSLCLSPELIYLSPLLRSYLFFFCLVYHDILSKNIDFLFLHFMIFKFSNLRIRSFNQLLNISAFSLLECCINHIISLFFGRSIRHIIELSIYFTLLILFFIHIFYFSLGFSLENFFRNIF